MSFETKGRVPQLVRHGRLNEGSTRTVTQSWLTMAWPTSKSFHHVAAIFNGRKHFKKNLKTACESNNTSRGGFRVLEWTGDLLPQGRLVSTAKFTWRQLWLAFMRELAPQSSDGGYQRPSYGFQGFIGSSEFPVEAGRYFLYLGNACPWCHRVAIAVALRNLSDSITVVKAVDDAEKASRGGWTFNVPEPAFGAKDLREVYDACSGPGGYRGRCTAPLLVDGIARKIVCNESSLLVRALNAVQMPGSSNISLAPGHVLNEIDEWNQKIGEFVNNGVYKCGFATSQGAYDEAERRLMETLIDLDSHLAVQRFLCSDRYFTEADLRLLPTAVRFDAVYTTLFKCCRRRWKDFPHLQAWLLDCLSLPLPGGGTVMDTVDLDECRRSYYSQLFPLNPGNIIPSGPTAEELQFGGPTVSNPGRGPTDISSIYYHL
jgi:putative glutathione S-transferase